MNYVITILTFSPSTSPALDLPTCNILGLISQTTTCRSVSGHVGETVAAAILYTFANSFADRNAISPVPPATSIKNM